MIVVDTNVIAYAVLPGERTEAALAVAGRDPEWVAPALWRWEFRNVLATAMRVKKMKIGSALAAFDAAEGLVTAVDTEPTTEECLYLSRHGGISAYDAGFVFLAQELDVPLVTADRRLTAAFPMQAIAMENFSAPRLS